MMKFKPSTLFSVVLTVAFLSSMVLMIATTTSAVYDPWADYNGDGIINIQDVGPLAAGWLTSGDPTKNVNVTNWPATNQQTVWYNQSSTDWSENYEALGFGHVHITWWVQGLVDPESVTFYVYAWIWAPDHSNGWGLPVQSMVVTAGNGNTAGALSFPVPSDVFNFRVSFAVGTTANVFFAYYLTYA